MSLYFDSSHDHDNLTVQNIRLSSSEITKDNPYLADLNQKFAAERNRDYSLLDDSVEYNRSLLTK